MAKEKQKLTVACVGAGYFAGFHYDAWTRIEQANLVASVDTNLESAKATGLNAYTDLDEMFEKETPDILDIVVPPVAHLDCIRTALFNGVKAIICQKPFCKDIEEALEAVALAKAADVPIIVHENFRFQPWYRIMKEAIKTNVLGDIHQITFRLRTGDGQGPEAYLDRQPYFQEMPKFLIHETGVHWIDTFRFLFGEPVGVYADLRRMNPVIKGEDAGYFILDYADGKRALFDANRHLDHSAENCRTTLGECLLEGTKGVISLSGNGELKMRSFASLEQETLLKPEAWQGFAGDCVHALQSHVVSAILGNGVFENEAKDYIRNIELEAAIYESAQRMSRVSV